MCGFRLAGLLTARGRNQLQRTDISDVRSPLYFYTVAHFLQTFEYKYNKFALLWGEAQLCLPYVYLKVT